MKVGNTRKIFNKEDMSIRIEASDSEEIRRAKRDYNKIAMENYHKRGAFCLPPGIPKNCNVEQPRAQMEHISAPTFKHGDTRYTNGLLRIQYINGKNRTEYKEGFAGRARTPGEMNGGEGVSDSGLHLS